MRRWIIEAIGWTIASTPVARLTDSIGEFLLAWCIVVIGFTVAGWGDEL